jgi:hypothetical protein
MNGEKRPPRGKRGGMTGRVFSNGEILELTINVP